MRNWINLFENNLKNEGDTSAQVMAYIHAAQTALAPIEDEVFVNLIPDASNQFYSENPIVVLDYIEVPEDQRGNGVATRAMRVLTELADKMQVTLGLIAADDDLAYWYERFGFWGDNRMIREPQSM